LSFIESGTIGSMMFDPPFLAGGSNKATGEATGIIRKRFSGYRTMEELWPWYSHCLDEFHRVLKHKGWLVFKCQDTVNDHKQFWSQHFIQKEAEKRGFYQKDLFILVAKNRMVSPNQRVQQHARKFHSYFLVFRKDK
jgi:tRNA G10  N-methylase Trm11